MFVGLLRSQTRVESVLVSKVRHYIDIQTSLKQGKGYLYDIAFAKKKETTLQEVSSKLDIFLTFRMQFLKTFLS